MISTHVLDTSLGLPASGISVKLLKKGDGQKGELWKEIGEAVTNVDGRCTFDCEKAMGVYQLFFAIEDYLKKEGKDYFFPSAMVVFKIKDTQRKYHVPLLLNPFGYSTYRGS